MNKDKNKKQLPLNHLYKNSPQMVNISLKTNSKRKAKALAIIKLPKKIKKIFKSNEIKNYKTQKGSIYDTSILAGIMASKKTHELIPLCHNIKIEKSKLDIKLNKKGNLILTSEVITSDKTGVEMEALTSVTIAALTIYDMCKCLSHKIQIKKIFLISKSGGKSNYKANNNE